MNKTLRGLTVQLSSLYRQGTRLAMLFDYDGTLTPIVENPSRARLPQKTFRVLERLASRPGIGVGIISSRGLDDLRNMVNLEGVYYAGSCGLELDLRGKNKVHPEAGKHADRLISMARKLEAGIKKFAGAWVENKPFGFTLHYRGVVSGLQPEVLKEANHFFKCFPGPFRVYRGSLALEVLPAVDWDKGSAVREILAAMGTPVFPFYSGDGANDQEAFAVTAALGGIVLPIGPDQAFSDPNRVENPAALGRFLHCLEMSLD